MQIKVFGTLIESRIFQGILYILGFIFLGSKLVFCQVFSLLFIIVLTLLGRGRVFIYHCAQWIQRRELINKVIECFKPLWVLFFLLPLLSFFSSSSSSLSHSCCSGVLFIQPLNIIKHVIFFFLTTTNQPPFLYLLKPDIPKYFLLPNNHQITH